jgi:hypothetical protein
MTGNNHGWYPRFGRVGLVSKGIVYCITGVMAFIGAFELGGGGGGEVNKSGIFSFVEQAGGRTALAILALGLLCYCIWRGIQAFSDKEHKGNSAKGLGTRAAYLLSGIAYLLLAIYAGKMALFHQKGSEGDSQQNLASQLLDKPFGPALLGIVALIIAGVGIYQAYYGLSGHYKKHVDGLSAHDSTSRLLLVSGRIGYLAKGIVWLLIAILLGKAALHTNAGEAGDTGKAFAFLEQWSFGSYLLGAVAFGLVCYGVFSFIRARYERF